MELRQLRYFVRVAEELHFGRAATMLGISQPPLSQQIRALEDELGLVLFERTSRRVRLTEPGRLLLDEARRTLAQADRTVEIARRIRLGEIGELSIGFTPSVPFVATFADALFQFRETHPDIHLELDEMPREAQIAALVAGTLDLGFLRSAQEPALPPGLVARAFLEEDMLVALRSDHPLALRPGPVAIAELADQPYILYQRALGVGFNDPLFALCRNAGFEPRVVLETSGPTTLLGLVAAGFGITVVARSLTALKLDRVVYRELDARPPTRLYLVYREGLTPACRVLAEIIMTKS